MKLTLHQLRENQGPVETIQNDDHCRVLNPTPSGRWSRRSTSVRPQIRLAKLIDDYLCVTFNTPSYLMFLQSYLMFLQSYIMFLQSYLMFLQSYLMFLQSYLMFLQSYLMFLQSYLMFLSHVLTELSHVLTELSHVLTELSHVLTELSHVLTELSMVIINTHLRKSSHHPDKAFCIHILRNPRY
jgi:uncharacterized coiled-coil protein SlyX